MQNKLYFYLIGSAGFTILLLIVTLVTNSDLYIVFVGLALLLILNLSAFFFLKNKKEETPHIVTPGPAKNITLQQTDELKNTAILAYIGEGLIVIDKSGKIITFNKAAESLLGWSAEEVLGKELTEVIKIDYKASLEESKSNPSRQSSLYFMRKDNTKFPAAITTTSYGVGTEILGTVTLFRDVTMEQNVDKMKNEFISLASHQLRTPLAAIKWYGEMLLKGDAGQLTPEQKEFTNTIYSSTERMIELVNLLLNISRIESGRINVEPVPTDLKQMVDEVVKEVKIRYEQKKQNFTVTYHDELPSINVDPRLIRQVYVNLLTNASKYTADKGDITVTVSKKDGNIISEIKDNGYGIPESDHDKIFGKFHRSESTANRVSQGTGLGLYLVKDIVELSHGNIWFESKEGKGTTFWFTLPLSGTPPKKGVLTLET